MSFLDTFRQKTLSKDKDENSFLKSFDKKQDQSSGVFSTESFKLNTAPTVSKVVDTIKSASKSFVEEATSDKIINSPFMKAKREAGNALAAEIRKPFEKTFGAVENLSKEIIEAPETISRIPAVQSSLRTLAERTSGTGIYSAIKASSPDITFDEAYRAARAYQANDPSKLNQFLYQLGDTVPQTAIGVALAFVPVAGTPLAASYFTGLSAAEQIEKKGYVYSMKNIATDVVLDRVLGASITSMLKAPGKSLLRVLRNSFVSEGGTEVAQDLLKYNNDYADATTDEERQAIIEEVKDYFKSGQILMTMGVGGIAGAGAGGGAFITNQSIQEYQNMTPGQRQAGFVRIPGMGGQQNVDVTGLNLNNPIDTVQEIADTHIQEARNVLADPDMTPEMLKEMGGEKAVVERAKINLSDGLAKINDTELATEIKNIKVDDATTIDSFNDSVSEILNKSNKIADDGFTFQQPLRSQAEDQEIAESVISARQELDLLQEEYNQMESVGAPTDTLARLQEKISPLESTFNSNPSVGQKERQIIDIYRNAGQSETLPQFTKAEEILSNILTELELSEPGSRVMIGYGSDREVYGVRSTFPQWLPESLRDKKLFEKLYENLSLQNFKIPTGNKTRQRELYNLLLDEVDAQLGVDTSAIRKEITEIYESKKEQTKESDNRGTKGDQILVTRNQAGQVDRVVDPVNRELLYDSKGPSNLQPPGQYPATPSRLSAYNAFRQRAASLWGNILEQVQNDWVKVEGWVKQKGEIDADKNPIVARTLYPGRLKTRVVNAIDEAKAIDLDVVKTAEKLKLSDVTLNKNLNDYLVAKHAPERNAKLGEGAAGITTEQANENLQKISELPYAKDIERIANKIYDLNKQTLEILYAEGNPWGLINSETKSLLESTYKNHVPLNRIFEETTDGDIVNVLNSKGLDVRGSGLKRAKGSERDVADILTNVTSNLVQAITRAEKNYINYQIYEMVEANPDTVAFVRPGTAIGKGFDERIIFAPENGENILPVMVDGQQKYIEFTDTDFAKTVRMVDTQKMPQFLKFVGAYGRLISQLVTRYSPEFLLTNKFRDVQEALIFAAAQPKLTGLKSLSKQAKKQLKIEGEKAIYDFLNKKNTEGAKLYKQMVADGGATGGLGMNTRKDIELNIEKIKKLNRSGGKQALEKLLNAIDGAGEVIENSTRFVVYKQALENGMSRKEAAVLAKESTVNFDRRGKAGPVINALYMFSNASIQGIAKNLRALRNPKVLLSTAGTIMAATFAISKYNEGIDEDWEDKISEFEKAGSLTILLPMTDKNGEHYRIVLPIAYGIRFLKVISNEAYQLTKEDKPNLNDSMGRIGAAFMDGYNPLGGTDWASTLTPTIGDLFSEVQANKKWSGSKIYPDYDPNISDSRKYFDSLGDTTIGRMLITSTKFLSDKEIVDVSPETVNYALEQLTGGLGQFTKKVINTGKAVASGEGVPVSEVPLVGKFLKETDAQAAEKYGKSEDRNMIKEIKSEKGDKSFDTKQEAKGVIANLKGKPKDVVTKELTDLFQNNKPVYDQVISQLKEKGKGLTDLDKQISSLNISDESRATYIYTKLETLKTAKEKQDFLNSLAEKKLINAKILKQVLDLKRQGKQE